MENERVLLGEGEFSCCLLPVNVVSPRTGVVLAGKIELVGQVAC